MFIRTKNLQAAEEALSRQACVALIGPRQVGKTTLALALAETRPSLYLDLESSADRDKLSDPALFLSAHADKLVILDEIHRVPELFQTLRGLIDAGRRIGLRTGRFLVLGSASIDLLRQSSETLAGRITYLSLLPFSLLEVHPSSLKEETAVEDRLWLRGGFPDSYLAANDAESFLWRRDFIRTYLERDIPQFGIRIPADTLERMWIMLAHTQSGLLNASRLACNFSVSAPTITHYIDLFSDLLLIRRLPPYYANVGKRLVKSPKIYVRDSGLVHALLGIQDAIALAGHPVVGASWEGYVLENLLAVAPAHARASFYRTVAGAEMDLVLEFGGSQGIWAIEIKRALQAKPGRGFYHAMEDIQPNKTFVVYAGKERYPLSAGVEAIGLYALMEEIASLGARAARPQCI